MRASRCGKRKKDGAQTLPCIGAPLEGFSGAQPSGAPAGTRLQQRRKSVFE
jgi:hypothetical protein